jgi:DNA-binding transcriptional LysR family regulator
MLAEIAQGRLVSVPLREPELVRPLGIVHQKKKKLNRAAQAFLALVTESAGPAQAPAPAPDMASVQ